MAYVIAVGVVLATIGLAFLASRIMPHANLSLLFLTGILIISARTGLGPAMVASVLSFFAFNFFFTPPFYTFEVDDDGDVATLVFFLIMAAITGNLAARMYAEIAERRKSFDRLSSLYEFGRRMSSSAGTEDVLGALADYLAQSLAAPVAVLLADPQGQPAIRAKAGPATSLPATTVATAWSRVSREPAVVDLWHFMRLPGDREPAGMVGIYGEQVDAEQLKLVHSLCGQATAALDRTRLVTDLEQARLVSETEQLRSALLSSVSHDLRTPLASIIGSSTSLLEYGETFTGENRRELLRTVVDESQRLDRYIQNLLDMTRLGQGKLSLQRDWVDLHDIVSSAAERMHDVLEGFPLDIDIAADVPLLWVHGVMIEQALVNLLDNALRFSPGGGRITITARRIQDRVEIRLCDEGPGIPDIEREKIFDMFYTVRQGDRGNLQGTGLGLAICRGMVGAHGGSVSAQDGLSGRGTCMLVVLPVVTYEQDRET